MKIFSECYWKIFYMHDHSKNILHVTKHNLSILAFFEVILLFSFPKFSMILTFIIFNWLRIVNAVLFSLSLLWKFLMLIWNRLIMNIFCAYFKVSKGQKVFNVVILLLLHPMCLVKFLSEILCVFVKSVCDFYWRKCTFSPYILASFFFFFSFWSLHFYFTTFNP